MRKVLISAGIFSLSVAAFALGSFLKVAHDTYNFAPGSAAAKAKCQLCHVGKVGGHLNAYGLDVKVALHGSKRITPAVLHSVDNLKSGNQSESNGARLTAGRLPGSSK